MAINSRISRDLGLRSMWWFLDLLTFVASLVLALGTYYAYNYAISVTQVQEKADFNGLIDKKTSDFSVFIKHEVNDLYHLRTHVGDMKSFGYKDWVSYMEQTEREEADEGKMEFLYIPMINKAELSKYEEKIRSENQLLKDFKIKNRSEGGSYFPIEQYFGSVSGFEKLMGYDLSSIGTISRAMVEANVSGKETITTLIDLGKMGEIDSKGYLILLPIFNSNQEEENIEVESGRSLSGYVGLWIEVGTLFKTSDNDIKNNLAYSVNDGNETVFESSPIDKINLKQKRVVYLLGRNFEVSFSKKVENNLLTSTYAVARPVTWALVIINTFWYFMIGTFWWLRQRAQSLAEDASSDLLKFKQAVEGVSDMVLITEPTGKILYANGSTNRLTGYTMDELEKTNLAWGGLLTEDFYNNEWLDIQKGERVFQGEFTNRRKTGDEYQVELYIWPIKDRDGNLVFFVGILKDLSAQKKVEKIKSDFMSLASHQLRTPMSAVKWFARMLWNGDAGELTEKQKEYLTNIISSNEREINVVNSLLNVSRIESGKMKLMVEKIDLPNLILEVVDKLKLTPIGEHKKFEIAIAPEIKEIESDSIMLRHVYDNLITNAVNYTSEEGEIKIIVSKLDEMIKTEVKDNGIGIAPSEQENVFGKFFRGSNAVKKVTDGNGLGLFLVKTIVESAGGKIGFESELDKGTTFWFTLPIKHKEG